MWYKNFPVRGGQNLANVFLKHMTKMPWFQRNLCSKFFFRKRSRIFPKYTLPDRFKQIILYDSNVKSTEKLDKFFRFICSFWMTPISCLQMYLHTCVSFGGYILLCLHFERKPCDVNCVVGTSISCNTT